MQKRFLNTLANIFLIPLLFISLLGAASVMINDMIEASKSGIILIDILFIIGIILLIFHKQKISFTINKRIVGYVIIIILLAWQTYLLLNVAGVTGWDPGRIIYKAMEKKAAGYEDNYFSIYPNTFLLLMVEHIIWKVVGHPESLRVLTSILAVFNYILLDLGLLNLFYIGKKYLNRKAAIIAFLLGIILLGMTPWAVIPYSDIPAFALGSFSITALLKLYSANLMKSKYCYAMLSGFLIGLDYLIKPSLVIIIIAFAIVALPSTNLHKIRWQHLGALVLLLVVPALMLTGTSIYQQNNSYIKLERNKAMPMMHFAAMGVNGNGGFMASDVLRDVSVKNPAEKRKVATEVWKKRVMKMGWTGYQAFLIKKQVANTADGTFAWGGEGNFLRPFKKLPNTLGQRLFYAQNTPSYNSAVKILLQLLWMGTLFTALFAAGDTSFVGLMAKYATVGFCLFLLLFEGGRSRYVIQFLPFILLLAAIGTQRIRGFFA